MQKVGVTLTADNRDQFLSIMREVNSTLEKNSQVIHTAAAAFAPFNSANAAAAQATTAFKQAQTQAAQALATLRTEQTSVAGETAKLRTAQTQTAQATTQLKTNQAQLVATTNELKQADVQLAQAEAHLKTQKLELNNATAQSKLHVQQLKEAQLQAKLAADQHGDSETKLSGILGLLNSNAALAAGAIGALGAKAVGIGVDAVGAFSDFEAQMNVVRATSDLTDQELKQLTDQAIQLGVKFPVSASDAAAGMGELSKAGFSANEIMAASNGLVTLASAANMDMASSATILAGAIRGFGLEAKDANRVTDLLAQTANASSVDVKDMGETFTYIGPVAKTAGFSIEDMSIAIGLMGNSMIKGSMAGTSLRSIITNLEKPPKQAAAAMDELGLSIRNQDGTAKSFSQIMGEMRTKMAGMNEQQKIQIATSIAGKEAYTGLLAVVDASPEDYQKMTDAIASANGKAGKMADIMNSGVKGAVENLKGSVEALQIKFGQALEPAILAVLGGLNNLAGAAGPVVEAFGTGLSSAFSTISNIIQQNVIPAVRQVWDWLGTRVGPVISAVGSVIRDNIIPAVQTMAAGFERELLPRLRDAWAFISQNLGPVLDGFFNFIANTAVPIFGTFFSVVSQHVIPILAKLADLVGTVLGPPLKLVGEIITRYVWPALEGIGHFVNDVVMPALGFLLEGIGRAIDDFKNFANALLTPVRILADNLPKGFDTYRDKLKEAVLATEEGRKKWNEAAEAFQEFNSRVEKLTALVNLPEKTRNAMNAMLDMQTAVGGAKSIIDELSNKAIENLNSKVTTFADFLEKVGKQALFNYGQSADTAAGKLRDLNIEVDRLSKAVDEDSKAMAKYNGVMDTLDKFVADRMSPEIQDLWKQTKELQKHSDSASNTSSRFSDEVVGLQQKMESLNPKMKDVNQTADYAAEKFKKSKDAFYDDTLSVITNEKARSDLADTTRSKLSTATSDMIGKILDTIPAMSSMQGKMQELPGTATNAMGGVTSAIKAQNFSGMLVDSGASMILGLIAGINSKKQAAMDAAAAVAAAATQSVRFAVKSFSPSRVFMQIGEDLMVGFELGIKDNADKPVGAAEKVADKVTNDALSAVKNNAEAMSAVAGASSKILELMNNLRNYTQVAYSSIGAFGQNVLELMRELSYDASNFDDGANKSTSQFGDTISKVMGGLSAAFSLFKELPDFTQVAYVNIASLSENVFEMMREITYVAQNFAKEGLDSAGLFGDAASKTTSGLKNALELFNGLRTYTQIPYSVLSAFIGDVRQAIDLAKDMAQKTDKDLLAQVGLFGEATGKLFNSFKAAMELFKSLEQFKSTPSKVIETFINEIKFTIGLADDMVRETDKDLLKRVSQFGEAISKIFNGFKSALELYKGLSDYKTTISDKIVMLMLDIKKSLKEMDEYMDMINKFVEKSVDYKEKMKSAYDNFLEAQKSFNQLHHLSFFSGEIDAAVPPTPAGEVPGMAGGGTTRRAGIYKVGEEGPEYAFLPAGVRVLDALTSLKLNPLMEGARISPPASPQQIYNSYANRASYNNNYTDARQMNLNVPVHLEQQAEALGYETMRFYA